LRGEATGHDEHKRRQVAREFWLALGAKLDELVVDESLQQVLVECLERLDGRALGGPKSVLGRVNLGRKLRVVRRSFNSHFRLVNRVDQAVEGRSCAVRVEDRLDREHEHVQAKRHDFVVFINKVIRRRTEGEFSGVELILVRR